MSPLLTRLSQRAELAMELSPELRKKIFLWDRTLRGDPYSQAPSYWKKMGWVYEKNYRSETRRYNHLVSLYTERILEWQANKFRLPENHGYIVADIGGGQGHGFGFARKAWLLGYKVVIGDISSVGRGNARKVLGKLERKSSRPEHTQSHTPAANWSVQFVHTAQLFDPRCGLDLFETVAVKFGKVLQHQTPEELAIDLPEAGRLLGDPMKLIIVVHPFPEENRVYEKEKRWVSTHSHSLEVILGGLSQGAGRQVRTWWKETIPFFDQMYTIFTIR